MAGLLRLCACLLWISCVHAVQRGLCYSNATLANYFSGESTITWGYDWGYPDLGLKDEWEFVPMLWGDPSRDTNYQAEWTAAVASAASDGSKHLLSFNEPDINGLSPQDAAKSYQAYINPHGSQFRLGAPAVTNGGPPTGLTWLEQFLGNCTGCQIDFVPIHWYANWDQPDYFAAFVQQTYQAANGRPLWITEFEGQGTVDQQVSFIKTVLPWLDSLAYVERYAYFGVFTDYLIDAAGDGLSGIGRAFAETTGTNSTVPTSPVLDRRVRQ